LHGSRRRTMQAPGVVCRLQALRSGSTGVGGTRAGDTEEPTMRRVESQRLYAPAPASSGAATTHTGHKAPPIAADSTPTTLTPRAVANSDRACSRSCRAASSSLVGRSARTVGGMGRDGDMRRWRRFGTPGIPRRTGSAVVTFEPHARLAARLLRALHVHHSRVTTRRTIFDVGLMLAASEVDGNGAQPTADRASKLDGIQQLFACAPHASIVVPSGCMRKRGQTPCRKNSPSVLVRRPGPDVRDRASR